MRTTTGLCLLIASALWLDASVSADESDLASLDLSGRWYVLIHYKDDRSADESLVKFKDFAWSVKQEDGKVEWENFPYVLFSEDQELVRKEAMRQHSGWQPSEALWSRIRERIGVSSRAAAKKTLRGSREKGFESLPPMGMGGANTLSFSRDWKLTFAPEKVRVQITDSLSGGAGLEGMEDSIVYEITERVSDGDLRGEFTEPHKRGTLRMVRTQKLEVLN